MEVQEKRKRGRPRRDIPGAGTPPLAAASKVEAWVPEVEAIHSAPPREDELARANFTFRMREDMRDLLRRYADQHGRPMSEEAEFRLFLSLRESEAIGSDATQVIFKMIAYALATREKVKGAPWFSWHQEAREVAIDVIEAQLGRSERWAKIALPPVIYDAVQSYRDDTTGFNSSMEKTVLELLRAGLEARSTKKKDYRVKDRPSSDEPEIWKRVKDE